MLMHACTWTNGTRLSLCSAAALPGVGPLKAEKIVSQLGADTLDILNGPQAVTRLCQCPTIGKASAAKIKKAWDENKGTAALI